MYEHNALGYWSDLALCLTKSEAVEHAVLRQLLLVEEIFQVLGLEPTQGCGSVLCKISSHLSKVVIFEAVFPAWCLCWGFRFNCIDSWFLYSSFQNSRIIYRKCAKYRCIYSK